MSNYHENLKVKEGDVLIHKETGDTAKVTSFDKNEDMVNVLINGETYDSWLCEHLQNSFIYGEMYQKSDEKDTELVKHF